MKNKVVNDDKFSEIGQAGYVPVRAAMDIVRQDVNIIFTYHNEETGKGNMKIKTAGKVVDNMLTLEGLFNFIFYTGIDYNPVSKETKYYFQTRQDNTNIAKTPAGCFNDFLIPNDMDYVLKRIEDYKKGIMEPAKSAPVVKK